MALNELGAGHGNKALPVIYAKFNAPTHITQVLLFALLFRIRLLVTALERMCKFLLTTTHTCQCHLIQRTYHSHNQIVLLVIAVGERSGDDVYHHAYAR